MLKNKTSLNAANECADNMLNRITECFKDSLKGMPQIKSAVVSAVNEDGTVDIYFPPNDKKLFTRISNQGAFTLEVGDGVELMLKNGTFDNCWVIAKHGLNRADMNTTQNYKENQSHYNNIIDIDSASIVGVTKTSQLINDSGFITKNSPTINTPTINTPTISSAKLTGTPTAPTPSSTNNSTRIATTAFVKTAISNVATITIDSSMSTTSTNALQNKIITQEINNLKAQIASLSEQITALSNKIK